MPMRVSLSRLDASVALVDGIRALQAGHDPLRDRDLGERYWMAIQDHVAPRVMARALHDLDIPIDEGDAVDMVMTRLELQVHTDERRLTDDLPPLLPEVVMAEDPIGLLIRCATKLPDLTAERDSDRYGGWVYEELVKKRKMNNLRSFDAFAEQGLDLPADPVGRFGSYGGFDERGFASIAEHTLSLVLVETPAELWPAVSAMVEWSVAAVPLVAPQNERNEKHRDKNRLLMAIELFSPALTEEQITALHNLVWGPATRTWRESSLLAHVVRAREAHSDGHHDRTSVIGKIVRDNPNECDGCQMTPLSGIRFRALVVAYADSMAKSVRRAA